MVTKNSEWERDYKAIRHDIRTGDIFFTASPSIFSRLIRFFTRSTVSHVGLFMWIDKRLFIVETLEGKGCRMMPASVRFRKEKFIWLPTHTRVTKPLERDILNDVGRVKYDLIGSILALVWDTKSSRAFCSEWVAAKLSIKLPHINRGIIPADIYTFYIN